MEASKKKYFMKAIKTLAILAILFTANMMSAQSVTSKWPALKTYEDVITRIDNGVQQGNQESISAFTGTLQSFSQQLTATPIPAQFNNLQMKEAVIKLQQLTTKLNNLVEKKATNDTLKPVYLETYAAFKLVVGLMSASK